MHSRGSAGDGMSNILLSHEIAPLDPQFPYYRSPSSQLSHAVVVALTLNKFARVEGTSWPTAPMQTNSMRGVLQMRPAEIDNRPFIITPEQQNLLTESLLAECAQFGDRAADVNDALQICWLEQAGNDPVADAHCSVDGILAMRGLQKHKGGSGRRGGFKAADRAHILQCLVRLQNLYIDVELDRSRSRGKSGVRPTDVIRTVLWVVSDYHGQRRLDGSLDVHDLVFHPGRTLAALILRQRQFALLSARALQYDPYREVWEKRLTRYLNWLWRVRARTLQDQQAHTVRGLLRAVGADLDPQHPARTRQRFERALDRLARDEVIQNYNLTQLQRDGSAPAGFRQGWITKWLRATITIEAPHAVRDYYSKLGRGQGGLQ